MEKLIAQGCFEAEGRGSLRLEDMGSLEQKAGNVSGYRRHDNGVFYSLYKKATNIVWSSISLLIMLQ